MPYYLFYKEYYNICLIYEIILNKYKKILKFKGQISFSQRNFREKIMFLLCFIMFYYVLYVYKILLKLDNF